MPLNSIKSKEIRKFGLIAFLFFGCLFIVGLWREKAVISGFLGALFFLGIAFVLFPTALKPVYETWVRITHYIGSIVTAIILMLAYFLVISPTALIKRLFGGRPLPVKPDKKADTYWVDRTEPAQPRERFYKRF